MIPLKTETCLPYPSKCLGKLSSDVLHSTPPCFADLKFVDVPRGPPITVTLKKEGAGLGFSLEGGKDSPYGDRPMTIKKIFTGEFNLRLFGLEFNL